jgi:AcrR family transcriptional regulator
MKGWCEMASDEQAQTLGRVPAPGRRLRPDDRRAEIIAAAREVFLTTGYDGVGLAEVAEVGNVSRGSIYRYFPNGRSDLFQAVAESLVAELHSKMSYAASMPFSASTRMEHLVAAVFAFFQQNPNAYRLLFRDVWAADDPAVGANALAARALLTNEIAQVIADSGMEPDEITAASAGILGFTLATVELAIDGALDPETAWATACRYATSQLG